MQTIVKNNNTGEIEISVLVPLEEAKKYLAQAAQNISRINPIKGFRPGMAPFEAVKNAYGNKAILDEFLDIALKETFEKAIKQNSFNFIGSPKIDIIKIAIGDDFEYKITYPVFPEFSIEEIEALKITLPPNPEVSLKEIDETINYILESRAKMSQVSRAALKGDYIDIDFTAKVGGVIIENGVAKNYGFVLGKGNFVQGFEDNLEGLSQGQQKTFSLMVSDNYPHKQIAGKKVDFLKVDFEVKVNAIFSRQIPELNDEFVKNLGKFNSVADFKKSLKEGILIEKKQEQRQKVRELILEQLRTKFNFPISQILIEEEALNILNQTRANIEKNGILWEEYLKGIGKDDKTLMEDLKLEAKRKIKNAFIINKIAKEKNIFPTDQEEMTEINNILKYYQTPQQAYQDFSPDELRQKVRQNLIYEKVFEFLEKIVGFQQ